VRRASSHRAADLANLPASSALTSGASGVSALCGFAHGRAEISTLSEISAQSRLKWIAVSAGRLAVRASPAVNTGTGQILYAITVRPTRPLAAAPDGGDDLWWRPAVRESVHLAQLNWLVGAFAVVVFVVVRRIYRAGAPCAAR